MNGKRRRKFVSSLGAQINYNNWYYTRGNDVTVQKWKRKWILVVGYYDKPERKVSKSNKRKEARSRDPKFSSDQWQSMFDSPEDAKLYAKSFRRHVENVVRGKRPKKLLSGHVLTNVEGNIGNVNLEKRLAYHNSVSKKRRMLMVAIKVAEICENSQMSSKHS